jgi:hypothetical protein
LVIARLIALLKRPRLDTEQSVKIGFDIRGSKKSKLGENPNIAVKSHPFWEITAMPHRYQLLEKIAFTLVVLSAVTCSGFIAWESSPDFRANFQQGKDLFLKSGDYSYACATVATDPCAQFPVE